MSKNSLNEVLQSLRILLAKDGQNGTDADLLTRFHAGDEASLAALVHRHGRMVLGVCRRVLGNEHDAEDACQATFLILAQKGSTICKKDSLGSWLHGVAFRVASDLRKKLNRHIMQPLPAKVTGAEQEAVRLLELKELYQALDEELARLPDRYRAPLVLCYLEGLTRDEAATRLGWSLNCFRGRLERGREMLRGRFCRRGLTLSAAIMATALVETAAHASVPASLVVSTVKSALLVAKGATPTALGLPELVGEILSKGTTMSRKASLFGLSLKKTWLLLTMAAVTIASGSILYRAYLGPSSAASWAADQPLQSLDPKEMVELSGRVLDPDGRPAVGAKVQIVTEYRSGFGEGKTLGTAGSDGTFRISVPRVALALHMGSEGSVSIVATSPGFGMAWRDAYPFVAEKDQKGAGIPELRLVKDDVRLHGRVQTPEGTTIEGAKVSLERIWANASGDLTSWVEAVKQNKNWYQARRHVPNELEGVIRAGISARTDRAGQFRLPGIGRGRVVLLRVTGPGMAVTTVLARTEPGDRLIIGGQAMSLLPLAHGCFGPEVVVNGTPSRPIVGIVRDLDTGKPVAGAIVQSHRFAGSQTIGIDTLHTHTDAKGHYQLDGMPTGAGNMVLARTPPDVAYLPTVVEVDTGRGEGPVSCNIKMKRGIWAVGRVLEAETGRPLSAYIDYYCLATNSHAGQAPGFHLAWGPPGLMCQTEDDGRFRIPVLPGRGVVLARLHGKELAIQMFRFRRTFQAKRSFPYLDGPLAGIDLDQETQLGRLGLYDAEPVPLNAGNYHAAAVLDVDGSSDSVTCDLRVGDPARNGG